MKIETGLNPNCSELVTKIDSIVSIKDVVPALIDLANTIDCSYGLEIGNYESKISYIIILPTQELADYLIYDSNVESDSKYVISYKKLLALYPDLPKAFEEGYERQPKAFYGKIKPGLYSTRKGQGDCGPYLNICENEGYTDVECLTFRCTQHCCSNEFPLLYKVIKHFGSREQAFDGGSTSSFEDWKGYWGVDCKADKEITEEPEFYSDVPPDYVPQYNLVKAKDFSKLIKKETTDEPVK